MKNLLLKTTKIGKYFKKFWWWNGKQHLRWVIIWGYDWPVKTWQRSGFWCPCCRLRPQWSELFAYFKCSYFRSFEFQNCIFSLFYWNFFMKLLVNALVKMIDIYLCHKNDQHSFISQKWLTFICHKNDWHLSMSQKGSTFIYFTKMQ